MNSVRLSPISSGDSSPRRAVDLGIPASSPLAGVDQAVHGLRVRQTRGRLLTRLPPYRQLRFCGRLYEKRGLIAHSSPLPDAVALHSA
jgi:hypothetical protein